MSAPVERTVPVNGLPCRVWEKGQGERLGFLPGFGGLPRWIPFLDRLAEHRRVIAPSIPGYPGARGHDRLDDIADWIAATLDLLEAADLETADLVGASVGGMLAAEVAALCRPAVRRLVLLAPLGLYVDEEPVTDVFARLPPAIPDVLCARDRGKALFAKPDEADPVDWQVETARANEASARLLWPLGDRGLAKRLHRITARTALVWGADDRVVPASYAKRFAAGIRGETTIQTIAGAGHLAYLDQPDAVAAAVVAFLD